MLVVKACGACGLEFSETPEADHESHGTCPRCGERDRVTIAPQ